MAISIQEEIFSDVIEEAQPLLDMHWSEIALNQDHIPLSPDYGRYSVMEGQGQILLVTARDGGKLIGYACFIVQRSLHYSTTVWALNDVIWLAPEHRKTGCGNALIETAEGLLKNRAVTILHFPTKVAHPDLARLLELRGYELVEKVFALTLNRAE